MSGFGGVVAIVTGAMRWLDWLIMALISRWVSETVMGLGRPVGPV